MSHSGSARLSVGSVDWRGGIAVRLLAILLVVTFALTLIASAYEYRKEAESMTDHLYSFAHSMARQGALACPDLVMTSDELALKPYVDDFVIGERFVVLAAVVRSRDGKVLACSPPGGLDHLDPATKMFEDSILIEREGDEIGTFRLGVTLEPLQAELRAKWSRMLLRTSIGFVLAAALFWLALRRLVLLPLQRLDQEADRLGRGELYEPVRDVGSTELGRLGRTLDKMRSNLLQNHRSLAAQNQRLLDLDRLKTQFLTNVSHEMRTPLTSVLGGIELLADATDEHARRETTCTVQRNGEQLLELVDRLLDLAKLQDGNLLIAPRACRIDRVVLDVAERFRTAAAAKGLELRVDCSAVADSEVMADPARVRQVLAALTDNAVKFTERGSVELTARWRETKAGRRFVVVVADTGPGIPESFLPRLFEPFSQADGSLTRAHGGTGLGLSMAQRIAECMDGSVAVENRPGGGVTATATFAVGAVDADAAAAEGVVDPSPAEADAAEPSSPNAARPRILVVDDAADNQRLLRAFLIKAGYEVELANNGQEAVAAVDAGRFDLVFMDLQMPVMDGVSAIRELRDRKHTLPIIALTAHAMAQDEQGCLDAGASGYETKPISGKRLVEVVKKHLAVDVG
ncbi:MAG: response regulator [Planctomycetes bacterium]|nr:response regulator [Planctomycetota bacterium]MCB9885867.1 response regulator [Planctomycetota bacterium]